MNRKILKAKNAKCLLLACCLFSTGMITSCRKYEVAQATPNNLSSSSKLEAKAYVNKRLTEYAKVFASLARNSTVRRLVNQGVAKKFDGDYNILIEDLGKILLDKKVTSATVGLSPNELVSLKKLADAPPVGGPQDPPVNEIDLQTLA